MGNRRCSPSTARNTRHGPLEKPMTLNETLLEKLANWRPSRASRQTLLAADEGAGWAATVMADRHDDMSTAVWEMMLRRSAAPVVRSSGDLSEWAQRVTGQGTGLLEPLASDGSVVS